MSFSYLIDKQVAVKQFLLKSLPVSLPGQIAIVPGREWE